jgi:hypothetical protein
MNRQAACLNPQGRCICWEVCKAGYGPLLLQKRAVVRDIKECPRAPLRNYLNQMISPADNPPGKEGYHE